jgi:hypothetical protein
MQTTGAMVRICESDLCDLTQIVEERLAKIARVNHKNFRSIDLWKIQKSKKRVAVRNFMY